MVRNRTVAGGFFPLTYLRSSQISPSFAGTWRVPGKASATQVKPKVSERYEKRIFK